MSLVQELQHRSSWKRHSIIILGIIGVGLSGYYGYSYWFTSEASVTTTSTTTTVKQGDITIGTESDGQIKGDNTIAIGFETNGTISTIAKKIGDRVSKGEIIGTINTSDLESELRKATNALDQAIANYNLKVKPLSSLELAQIDASLNMSKINYDTKILGFEKDIASSQKTLQDLNTKRTTLMQDLKSVEEGNDLELKQKELQQQLIQKEKDLSVQIDDIYQKNKDWLRSIDEIMGFSMEKSNNNDAYETFLSVKNSSYKYQAESLWNQLQSTPVPSSSNLAGDMLVLTLDQASKDAQQMRLLAQVMIDVIDNSVASESSLSQSQLNTRKSTFTSMYNTATSEYQQFETNKESYKTSLLSATSSLDTSTDTQSDKIKSLKNQIAQVDADITYQNQQIQLKQQEITLSNTSNTQQLKQDQIDYQLKLDPLSDNEKYLYQLQLESARLNVVDKKLALEKATLKSPVDGVILSINGHPGETVSSNFITIATQGYTYIETSLDEDDINSIKQGQLVSFVPDALEEVTLTGEVYYIASEGSTDSNGLVTYQVLIKYTHTDDRVKVGMKGTITFIKKQVSNVLILPIKAVVAYQNSPHVRTIDGRYISVVTGLSDGKQTEVISGVQVGQTVLLSQ